MPYKLNVSEAQVLGKGKYQNEKGSTECVEFVRQAAGAPQTKSWKRGKKVEDAGLKDIERGTAIATFDDQGRYPTDALGQHAAIYLSHDKNRIVVLDQWRSQGEVKERSIWFNRPKGTKRSNDGSTFYVIE